jgi:anti-sigma regulatory factor (Ser/Thr protein kinase)
MMSVQLRRTMELPCELQSVTFARHFVRDALVEWGLPQLADDAQLGVSELVANVVRHARTPVELTLELNGGVRIAVRDRHPELRRPSLGRQVDAFAENGRGLQLVAGIAQDWGISARGDGKVIWFALNPPDTSAPDADLYALDGYRVSAAEAGTGTTASTSRDGVGAQAHLA